MPHVLDLTTLRTLYRCLHEGEPEDTPLLDLLDEPWVEAGLRWLGLWEEEETLAEREDSSGTPS